MPKKRVIVIGGGAGGLMAAGTAAQQGHNVILIEKNNILGKKLLITGKGRCNVTNACDDVEILIQNVPVNGTFLYSAFYSFTNKDTMEFLEKMGVPLKTERGERVFPISDKSADIVTALRKYCVEGNVEFKHGKVNEILLQKHSQSMASDFALHNSECCHNSTLDTKQPNNFFDNKTVGVLLDNNKIIKGDAVIIATGGLSYPQTGSTGDGYLFAKQVGHKVILPKPSLVPLEIKEKWASELQGLSLKNIELTVTDRSNKSVYTDFGEMLFTHFGVSGPVILSASAHMNSIENTEYKLFIDLKPGLTEEALDKRIQRDFLKYINKDFKNSLCELLPSRLIDVIIKLSKIPPTLKVNSITREQRGELVKILKNFLLTVKGFRPIDEAIITSGGISTKEIDPSTMQSKIISGLYFCGEVIDVNAYTGGFNLQIAFSTGYLAGISVTK